jgi:bleomycin hydrolase
MKQIANETILEFNEKYQKKPVQNALRRVLMQNELSTLFEKQEQKPATQFRFSNEIKTLPVTNQKASGRCWLFAGLNVLRTHIAKKYNLQNFELSQNYTAFYDKFEKINYFIESIDDFLDSDQDDRTLQHILKTGIQDGGQWDMFVSLVEKYGVVPKEAMVETASSGQTRFMNQIINVKLRRYTAFARKIDAANRATELPLLKQRTLEELYTFLVTNFGMPPKQFDFEYINKEDQYHIIKNLTPQVFYGQYMDIDLKDYVSIIHAPTKDKPFLKTFTVQYLGNVVGGREIKYLNVEMKDMKALMLKQLLNQEVVWFGADVARFGNRKEGYWDDQSFDIEAMLEMGLDMSKADQLDYSQSAMNHAMVITAVNLDGEVPNRWKIENSWSESNGNKGYYLATDSWFDQYLYQAVIHVKYLSESQKNAWRQDPIVLKPWDPMGSLA